MPATSDLYLDHAHRCEADAARADLAHVRARDLRSAAAWHAMAARRLKFEQASADRGRLANDVRAQCLA
ncbi:hypothetical protein FHR22_000940 [Sphingopyxis panaciterrae]|jgi:hypothetical protein|nr:hypothetical protein [Sphingopyxis panaciterrae]